MTSGSFFVVQRGSRAVQIKRPNDLEIQHGQERKQARDPQDSFRANGSRQSPQPESSRTASHGTSNEIDDARLDVYARPFVPQALSIINTQPALVIDTKPAKDADYEAYTRTFAGTHFLPMRASEPVLMQPETRDDAPDHLDWSKYNEYFQSCLATEIQAQQGERWEYNLYAVPLDQPTARIYTLHVAGLRENTPRVEVGDTVMLRQLRLMNARNGKPLGMESWLNGGMHRGEPAPGWTGIQHNSRVVAIDRNAEVLHIKADALVPESMRFNVMFPIQWQRMSALQTAVSLINEALHQGRKAPEATPHSRTYRNWIRRMLFPSESDGSLQTALNQGFPRRRLFDQNLNFEQLKAVDSIYNLNYGEVPFLISGPPGTGKTKTLVETALQLISEVSPVTHILACAPSDPAADTLAQRLRQHLKPSELLRLNGPSRSFPEVPGDLMPYSFVDSDMFALPPFAVLMKFKIVVTTCRDAMILISARLTNQDLYNLERGLLSTLHPRDRLGRRYVPHWGALLIDEAAQATEPEAAIPLAVVAPPPEEDALSIRPAFIMAGDQKQLGPRTSSKSSALKTSLFERLFDRSLYTDHPLARSRTRPQAAARVLTKAMLPILRPPFANLIRNYRSHPAILAIPSALFYNDTLIPEASDVDSLQSWDRWKRQRWPVIFAYNAGSDEIERDGGGWYNVSEAREACGYAVSLLQSGLIQQEDICIMSPYSAQVRVAHTTLNAHHQPTSCSKRIYLD